MVGSVRAVNRPTRAWYTKVSPDRHRLFAGRHYDAVAVAEGELVVTSRRGRTMFQAPLDSLALVRVRNGLLLQVLARDADANTHVFEFRPKRHGEGRSLADALR
jgi:hypothetical protein